jgi:L-ascorbate metabolism protein UlaG (beta-lactamase superfamily)
MVRPILPPLVPDHLWHHAPVPKDADVRLRFLGTAGFVITGAGHTVVIDPFVTRPGLVETVAWRLRPNEALIRELLPTADDVLIGHAHHDHVLDGPSLCAATGARFVGSSDACNVARAYGLPEDQLVETRGRERLESGPATYLGLPSGHGRVYLNRVSLPGKIDVPPPWPPRFSDLRHGQVLSWYLELAGVRIVHIDTAEFVNDELEGLEADVVCLCAIGRRYRPNYVADAIRLLRPKLVIPCHWDWFFTPYHAAPRTLPGVDLAGFVREIEMHGVEAAVMRFDGEIGVSATR